MRCKVSAVVGLACLLATAPAQAQSTKKNHDTTFEEMQETPGGRRLLFCVDRGPFRIPKKVYTNAKRIWPFIKRGDKINVWVKGDILLRITMGWKRRVHINRKIMETVRKLKEGNKIRVNGESFQFIRRSKTKLVVNQILFDGEINPLETEILLARIKKLAIEKEAVGDFGDPEHVSDPIKTFLVSEGDTVLLQLDAKGDKTLLGVVEKLTPLTCHLIEWKRGAYGETHTIQRRDVVKVSPRPVSFQRSYPVGDGSLTLKVERFRRQKEGAMTFDIEVVHDAPRTLLDRFDLTFNLSEEIGAEVALAIDVARVPMLFPDKPYTIKHTAINARYRDATISVPELKALPYDSKEAEPHILRYLDRIKNEQQLRDLYMGRAASKDPEFMHLLLSRVMIPPVGRINSKVHADLSLETLIAAGGAGADAILADLLTPDDALEVTQLMDGRLERSPLPDRYDRREWRKRLITQLASQPQALEGGRAKKLFAFYCANESLMLDLEGVFYKSADEAVRAVFEAAIPRQGSTGDEKRKTELAAALLRNLKDKALDAIDKELVKRGIPGEAFVASRRRFGASKAEKAIDVALQLAAKASKDVWLGELDDRVAEAKALAKAGKEREALVILEEVLAKNPKQESALDAFPSVTIPLAARLKNGEAALMLEETIKLTPEAKAPLAELLLRGVTEDVEAVSIRDRPTVGGVVVAEGIADARFPGDPVGDWVELRLPRKRRGYVRKSCATPQGGEYVIKPETPFESIKATIDRIKELDPTQTAAVMEQWGHLNAREGAKLNAQGEFERAAPYFEVAEEFSPSDPRLAEAGSNWFKANQDMLALIAVVVVVFVVAGAFVGKKIKEELVAEEDLHGQSLEIRLDYGVEAAEWADIDDEDEDEDEDEDDDGQPVAAGAPAGDGGAQA